MANLPIDANTKDWIDARASWLLYQFGREHVRSCTVVTPNADVLPRQLRPMEEDARKLFDSLCKHLMLDSDKFDLEFFYDGVRAGGDETALGLYEPDGKRYRIWIEATQLHDPPSLVATMAHELSHVHLLGHGRVTEDTDDHEPLTDLLTVFFGLGIFSANAALYDVNQRSGNWELWQIQRRGYLTMPMFGYALALYSQIRDEFEPKWSKHLRPDVRHAFLQSLRYFNECGLPDLHRVRTTTSRPSFIFSDQGVTPSTNDTFSPSVGESGGEDGEITCGFCGRNLAHGGNDGVCRECQESIEENQRELSTEKQYARAAARNHRFVFRLGCGSFVAVFTVLLILEWLGVLGAG